MVATSVRRSRWLLSGVVLGDDCLSKYWSWKKFLKQVETLLLPLTKELKVVTGVRRS